MPFPQLADHAVVSEMYSEDGSAYLCNCCGKKYQSTNSILAAIIKQHIRSVHQEQIQDQVSESVPVQHREETGGNTEKMRLLLCCTSADIFVTDIELRSAHDEDMSLPDKKKEALLVMKTLKSNHPMSDKLIVDLFKAISLGVDSSTNFLMLK